MPRGCLTPIRLAACGMAEGPSMDSSLTFTADELGAKTLLDMFPGMHSSMVSEVLRVVGGDLVKAAEYLAEMAPAHEIETNDTATDSGPDRVPIVVKPNEDSNFPSLVSTVPDAWDVISKANVIPKQTEKDVNHKAEDDFVMVNSLDIDEWCVVEEDKPPTQATPASTPVSYASCVKA